MGICFVGRAFFAGRAKRWDRGNVPSVVVGVEEKDFSGWQGEPALYTIQSMTILIFKLHRGYATDSSSKIQSIFAIFLVCNHLFRLIGFQVKNLEDIVSVPEAAISLAIDVHGNRSNTLQVSLRSWRDILLKQPKYHP